MSRKNFGSSEFVEQESFKLDENERNRLNEILRDVRDRSAGGTIIKARFIKCLMGIEGYEMASVIPEHREYLAGIRKDFPRFKPSLRSIHGKAGKSILGQ